ncbi:hypothetical protein IJG89_03060 [Candidatus Saccharibacteria bacterium]|nr:hypothetical protein [Candidatus Saccharibacteria bacterium]
MINFETMSEKKFVKERIKELGVNSIRKLEKEDLFFEPVVDGFFDAEMKLQPGSGWGASFCVNDDSIYAMAAEVAKVNFSEGIDAHKLALWVVQEVLLWYFGDVRPSLEDFEKRERRFSGPSSRVYALSEIKEGAMCYERAAVAHNLLLFLGEKSRFVVGFFAEDGKNDDQHAFVLTDRDDRIELYDPMNPIICYRDRSYTHAERVLPYTIPTDYKKLPPRSFVVEGDYEIKYRGGDGEVRKEVMSRRRYRIVRR